MILIQTAAVVSLGCPKNTVDTEIMLHQLEQEYRIVDDFHTADILVVNTCGFIKDAKEESINTIFDLAQIKKGSDKILIVTGCLSQRYSEDLLSDIPEINICMGVEQYLNILPAIRRAQKGERFALCGRLPVALIGKRRLITPKHTVYVKISEGCNNACTFCAIPMIRGRYRSVPMEDVLAEMKGLVAQGAREIIFVAEDTTRYGVDLYKKPMLAELLRRAAQIPDLQRIRLHYCYPDTLTTELIDVIAAHDNICNYIDIPLQHADEDLLKSMHRRGTPAEFTDTIHYARSKGILVRTTFIVGFPGETEAQFGRLVDFVKQMRFDRLGVFTYSPEEGTKAAEMPNQIPEGIKEQRKDIIMTLQADIAYQNNQERIGERCDVLVERFTPDGKAEGRSYGESPDIDGLVILDKIDGIQIGGIYPIEIVGADTYDLYAEWRLA